jgi:hypothetical protein
MRQNAIKNSLARLLLTERIKSVIKYQVKKQTHGLLTRIAQVRCIRVNLNSPRF